MKPRTLFLGFFLGLVFFSLGVNLARAQATGTIRGTVYDPNEGVIPNAMVTLQSAVSTFTLTVQTDAGGSFILSGVPAGAYTIEIGHEGFNKLVATVDLIVGGAPFLKFVMQVGTVTSVLEVTAPTDVVNTESSSAPVTVDERDILHTPGAERASSLAFITDYVPGAYMLHDHLHMRGGHQVTWLVDGVPVPNTNISSNVGRQMDPKDMETVEVSRGGYNAKYGDRTYGMINIVPRSGFEFASRSAELTLSYGSYNQTSNQLSFGGHSNRFAYYGSVSGNRSDIGLEPPSMQIIHGFSSGLSGFTSLGYNLTNSDQLRLSASLRTDYYHIPNTPADQAAGVRDVDREQDGFANFSWVHTYSPSMLLTVSPFYHGNVASYDGGPLDPLVTVDHRSSHYGGAQVSLGIVKGPHNFSGGVYGFVEHDNRYFSLKDQTGLSLTETAPVTGGVGTVFVDEQFKPAQWLTLNGGLRLTHFSGKVNENAADPRIGASILVPRLKWVLRGFFGTYYQPPPLETISGPVLNFALAQGISFLPVHGERDQQREFGLSIPLRGWSFDFSHFRTAAKNFSDHDVLGNTNITLPLAIHRVTVRGWEAVVRSPNIRRRMHLHLAYSNQVVKGHGAITGGMTDFTPPTSGYFYIDHDQRHTLSTGADVVLPWRSWVNTDVVFGSGFLDQNGPQHLPSHTQVDIAMGKTFAENISVTFTALNIANSRFLFGRDNAFAGTHYNDPRQFIGSVRYRFHW